MCRIDGTLSLREDRMKEIIGAVLVVVGIWGGTRVLADFYETAREAALEKAAQGLPSLTNLNHQLHRPRHRTPTPSNDEPADAR